MKPRPGMRCSLRPERRRLNADAKKVLSDPGVAADMADFSTKIVAFTSEALEVQVSQEIAKWAPVVKDDKVQMD